MRLTLEANAKVIAEATRTIGNAGIDLSGELFAGVQEALQNAGPLVDRFTGPKTIDFARTHVVEQLTALGLTMDDLAEVADKLGISLSGGKIKAEELQQILEALAATELTQFTDTFEGQKRAFQDFLDIFDITDPLDQLLELQKFVEKIGKDGQQFSPALAKALAGLDLNDPAQRAEADRRLRELFLQLNTGAIKPEDLGLTLDQFEELLKQLESTIDQVNLQDGSSTSGSRAESAGAVRGITEASADHLIGTLTSIDLHVVEGLSLQREALDVDRQIRDLLASLTLPAPLPAPAFPVALATAPVAAGGGAPGGITVQLTIEQITIAPGAGESGVDAAGRGIARGLAQGLDSEFGGRARVKAWLAGQTLVAG